MQDSITSSTQQCLFSFLPFFNCLVHCMCSFMHMGILCMKNACSSLTACLLSTPSLLTWSPGETFDRQASVRRSLINTDTLARRPKKVKRRKTISGLPDNIQQELGMVWLCQFPPLLLLPCLPLSRLHVVV